MCMFLNTYIPPSQMYNGMCMCFQGSPFGIGEPINMFSHANILQVPVVFVWCWCLARFPFHVGMLSHAAPIQFMFGQTGWWDSGCVGSNITRRQKSPSKLLSPLALKLFLVLLPKWSLLGAGAVLQGYALGLDPTTLPFVSCHFLNALSYKKRFPWEGERTTAICENEDKRLASTHGLHLFSKVVVVSSLKILGFPCHVQLVRFPEPGMVSLLLSMVLCPVGKLLVTTKLCLPLLHT